MNAHRDGTRPSTPSWPVLALGIGGGTILVVLLARTAVGAIDREPGPVAIAALAAVGFALAMTAWRLDDAARTDDAWQRRAARATAALLSGLLFGLLIARDSTGGVVSVTVMALTWSVAAALRIRPAIEARLSAAEKLQTQSASTSVAPISAATPATSARAVPVTTAVEPLMLAGAMLELDHDPSLQMQLRRCRTADGETIEIHARLEIVAGARESVLHVPFWPALLASPVVECEPLDADDVELRITSAEPYGLRLEARLPAVTAIARSVLIGVEVHVAVEAAGIAAAA